MAILNYRWGHKGDCDILKKTLGERGDKLKIISSQRKGLKLKGKLLYLIKNKMWPSASSRPETAHFDNNNYSWNEVTHPGPIVDAHIPEGDIVIATWWETAIWVNSLGLVMERRSIFSNIMNYMIIFQINILKT